MFLLSRHQADVGMFPPTCVWMLCACCHVAVWGVQAAGWAGAAAEHLRRPCGPGGRECTTQRCAHCGVCTHCRMALQAMSWG